MKLTHKSGKVDFRSWEGPPFDEMSLADIRDFNEAVQATLLDSDPDNNVGGVYADLGFRDRKDCEPLQIDIDLGLGFSEDHNVRFAFSFAELIDDFLESNLGSDEHERNRLVDLHDALVRQVQKLIEAISAFDDKAA